MTMNTNRPLEKHRSRTPVLSIESLKTLFESPRISPKTSKKNVEAKVSKAPQTHKQAKKQALDCDNWRCVVTHMKHPTNDLQVQYPAPKGPDDSVPSDQIKLAYTECTHIIPEATFFNVDPAEKDQKQLDYCSSIFAILHCFCPEISNFIGPKVHSLTNVMTLEKNSHEFFDEPTGPERDTYRIENCGLPVLHSNPHPIITFTTHNAETHPVPSPELLTLHATCCKVAWFSGSAKYLETYYWDIEDVDMLAGEGTSDAPVRYKLADVTNPIAILKD